jgi:hypothetical protein
MGIRVRKLPVRLEKLLVIQMLKNCPVAKPDRQLTAPRRDTESTAHNSYLS